MNELLQDYLPLVIFIGVALVLSIGLLGFLSDRIVVLVRDILLTWNKRETFGGEN